jgi:excisionase family DNA binding protein
MSELEQAIEKIVRKVLAERDVKPANDPTTYLSTSEAATFARVSVYTIRRWVRAGELTRHMAGTRVLVDRGELEKLLACDVVSIDSRLSVEERVRRRFG